MPKGAMISHRNMASVTGDIELFSYKLYSTDVYLSFLPLPHILEKICVLSLFALGATICFYSGDLRKMKDDLALVRPTFLIGVPRIFNRFYSMIQENLEKKSPFLKFLVNLAV